MSPVARYTLIVTVAISAAAAGFFIANLTQSDRADIPGSASNGSSGNVKLATTQLLALSLPDTNAADQALRQWRGKLLVVNFWATWCPPCREEMPGFSRLQAKYASNGVQFLGIAFDTADKVREFSGQTPVNYPLLIGGYGLMAITAGLGDAAGGLPFTVIIGRDGTLLQSRLGMWKEAALDAILADQTK